MAKFTIDELRRILIEGAGAEIGVDLDDSILDTQFEDLGYDSLALMETAARISREYGIELDDDAAVGATTPRRLIELVNAS